MDPKKPYIPYLTIAHLVLFVIFSIIYHVKYCHNRNQYCSEICTEKYLAKLASYPYQEYCMCFSDFSCED